MPNTWPYYWNAQPWGLVDTLAPEGVRGMIFLTGWCGGELSEYTYTRLLRPHIGKSIDNADLRAGGICAITGCTAPSSRMKWVSDDGKVKRVIDTVKWL